MLETGVVEEKGRKWDSKWEWCVGGRRFMEVAWWAEMEHWKQVFLLVVT